MDQKQSYQVQSIEDNAANLLRKKKISKNSKAAQAKQFLQKDHHDSNMVVAVRVRPLSRKEKEAQDFEILQLQDKLLIVMDRVEIECSEQDKKPDVLHRSKEQRFFFDIIFPKQCHTPEVYENTCAHLVPSVIAGYNACVFAYGTTGSGKTYTMTGTMESPGIMVLILQDLFKAIQEKKVDKEFSIKMSYVEIYNEVILDLLIPNARDQYLDLREDPVNGTCIAGVTEFVVKEPKEVMNLLTIGNKRRTTEATMANAESSRSHAICQIMLITKDRIKNTEEEQMQGKLSLIDLAGSERGTVTENRGIRLREGAKINTSLLALANCINALGDKNKKGFFVPFRDSKLTRMLKDSLGGNCKTVMITTVSPASQQYEETINTLKYANRAKNIKMRVEPNKKLVSQHISAYKNIIADLRDEIDKLKMQLQSDIANKVNPLVTKHTGMYPRRQRTNSKSDNSLLVAEENVNNISGFSQHADPVVCECAQRQKDEIQKQSMLEEIHLAYEEILQLEQALIELDEQNTTNTLEIRKREAKVIFMLKQAEEIEEVLTQKENSDQYGNLDAIREQYDLLLKQVQQHRTQIEILNESTKQNLLKRQQMRMQLYEYYSQIRQIRDSIQTDRIMMPDNKDFLALVIKNNYLESQNVQLLLNLQLQARTIIDLKNMIHKQQLFIEENDIGMSPAAQAGNIEIFLGDNNDLEQDDDDMEDNNNMDDPEDDQHLNVESKEANRPDSQLRFSQNGIPAGGKDGLEGFEGIVGIGAGGKKAVINPKSAFGGQNNAKKDLTKPKKPEGAQEKKEAGPPLSLGVFGSGMQKK